MTNLKHTALAKLNHRVHACLKRNIQVLKGPYHAMLPNPEND